MAYILSGMLSMYEHQSTYSPNLPMPQCVVFSNGLKEMLGMLLEEFDKEKYERTIRGEGREAGLIYSIEIMQEVNASRDSAKRKLMEKFSFTEEEAERKLLLYWK